MNCRRERSYGQDLRTTRLIGPGSDAEDRRPAVVSSDQPRLPAVQVPDAV